MTPEQRLDRLKRIAKLFVRAELRARNRFRQQHDILLDAQMRCEARFAQNEERFQRDEERLSRLSEETDRRFAELAESQARTDRSLAELIMIVTKGRNGNPLTDG